MTRPNPGLTDSVSSINGCESKGERDALHIYLTEKIRVLARTEHTQLTVCTTWVVEIFLKKLRCVA